MLLAVCLVAAVLLAWRARPMHVPRADEAAALSHRPAAPGDEVLALQRAIERRAERRITSLVGTVVGRDRIVVRVTATLEPARLERTEQSVDPDRAALRSQYTRRHENGAREDHERWEVSKVVSRTIAPGGVVKQLSAAVLIDGAHRDVDGQTVFAPRPAEELEQLRGLVASALGFSEARGDRIEIVSLPFDGRPSSAMGSVARTVARLAVLALVGVVLLVAGRAGLRRYAETGVPPVSEIGVARLTEENEAVVRQHPERAARLVREWLRDPARGAERAG